MAGADIAHACIIVSTFVLLFLVNVLSVGLKNIEENWHLYKCNPLMMPFASAVGKDGTQNFLECIESMQASYMEVLLEPINLNFSMMTNIVGDLTDAISGVRVFIDSLRTMLSSVTEGIFGAFGNILAGFIGTLATVKDMMARLLGTLAITMYAMEAGMTTGVSINNGPPGQLLRTLSNMCFGPDTLVKMHDNTEKKISLCVPGDMLANDNRVESCMQLDNSYEGAFKERMYSYDGGRVTGSHLVYDKLLADFIPVKDTIGKFAPATENYAVLHCLITTRHIIQSGEHVFHDWEDLTPSR